MTVQKAKPDPYLVELLTLGQAVQKTELLVAAEVVEELVVEELVAVEALWFFPRSLLLWSLPGLLLWSLP
jgi:hypothetical protein